MRGSTWTTQDVDTLHVMVDAGYSYNAIARRLKRTRTAVMLKAKRLNHRLLTTPAALTCRDVAELLGLGCSKTVARWIEAYGLKARNGGTSEKPLWRIQWDDFTTWMDDPQHWMMFDPERCTDRLLREHLIESRIGQPRWLSVGDVASRFCVGYHSVNKWILSGSLPATRYGNWWINERDLQVFTPPHERSKVGTPKRVIAHRDLVVQTIKALRSTKTLHEIARQTGVSISTVHRLAHS